MYSVDWGEAGLVTGGASIASWSQESAKSIAELVTGRCQVSQEGANYYRKVSSIEGLVIGGCLVLQGGT